MKSCLMVPCCSSSTFAASRALRAPAATRGRPSPARLKPWKSHAGDTSQASLTTDRGCAEEAAPRPLGSPATWGGSPQSQDRSG
eukprot:9364270-Alexandrium_andersonii.AAC.1